MLIKKIKYKDFMDVEREEEFMFNLNKGEIIKWLTTNGNYTIDSILKKMIDSENVKDLINEFETLIMMSYGERSLDGRQFVKSQEVKDRFRYSAAYDALFMELVGDAQKAAAFFNAIVPADLAEEVNKMMQEHPEQIPDTLKEYMIDTDTKEDPKVVSMPGNNQ